MIFPLDGPIFLLKIKTLCIESLRHYALSSIDIQDIFLAVLSKRKNGTVITFDQSDFKKLDVNFSEP